MIGLNLTGYNTEIRLALFWIFFKHLQAMAFLTLKRESNQNERVERVVGLVASKYSQTWGGLGWEGGPGFGYFPSGTIYRVSFFLSPRLLTVWSTSACFGFFSLGHRSPSRCPVQKRSKSNLRRQRGGAFFSSTATKQIPWHAHLTWYTKSKPEL